MRCLIVFSPLRWSEHSRARQLMTRLARHLKVVYVEPPIAARAAPCIERQWPAAHLEVLVPHLPEADLGDAAGAFDGKGLPALKALLGMHFTADFAQTAGTQAMLWFCTPAAWPLAESIPADVVVYDCLPSASGAADTSPHEADLLARADLVIASGPARCDTLRRRHPHVVCLPDAIDPTSHAPRQAMRDTAAVQRAQAVQGRIPHPRLGHLGPVDETLDLGLLAHLADAQPSWQVVVVGEPAPGLTLPQRPNLHWVCAQPPSIHPQLVAGWDVCLLPLRRTDATRFSNPPETLAYLAADKPVVARAVGDVAALYGEVVAVAEDAAQFVALCHRDLHESMFKRVARITRGQSLVARSSWDTLATSVRRALDGAGSRHAQRLQRQRREAAACAPPAPATRVPTEVAD